MGTRYKGRPQPRDLGRGLARIAPNESYGGERAVNNDGFHGDEIWVCIFHMGRSMNSNNSSRIEPDLHINPVIS